MDQPPNEPAPGQPAALPPPPASSSSSSSSSSPPVPAGPTPGNLQLDPQELELGISLAEDGVRVPATAYATLKAAARDAYERELSARAATYGFTDIGDMFAALEEIARSPTPPTQETPVTTPADPAAPTIAPPAAPATPTPAPVAAAPAAAAQPGAVPGAAGPVPGRPVTPQQADDLANNRALPEHIRRKWAAERDRSKAQAQQLTQQVQAANTQVQGYEQQMAALRAEGAIKLDMVREGVQDLEFAWFSFQETLKAMKQDTSPEGVEKLKTFSTKAWVDAQRASRPYIFGQQAVPAQTGAPTGAPLPIAQDPAAVQGAAAGAGAFNGRQASASEFEKRMAAHGIPYRAGPPARG